MNANAQVYYNVEKPSYSGEVIVALQTAPAAALLVGRNDLWLKSVEQPEAGWSEWELSATTDLLAPVVSPELMQKYRSDPRSKAWLIKLRLPEYWRQVGWPEQCRPLGEDDFECG